MNFSEKKYEVVRNALQKQLINNLKIEFMMIRDLNFFVNKTKKKFDFGDTQCPKSFSSYGLPCFDSLLINLNQTINEITGKTLFPTYSYSRIYYEGATLEPHLDRSSCEYSATICIDTTDLWDFFIQDTNNEKQTIILNPGDMLVYSGCDLLHWRDPYKGKQQIQCFLHYVDANGKYKDYKYDGREILGTPKKVSRKKGIINY